MVSQSCAPARKTINPPGLRIGKTRGNVDLNLRWEIFKDFFWGVGVYYTYDGQAETEEASDYGSFISLGWKF